MRNQSEGDRADVIVHSQATNNVAVNESPPKEEFPPYLPAIMGCRSVSEFQCLNK